jgi:hypothetical protein
MFIDNKSEAAVQNPISLTQRDTRGPMSTGQYSPQSQLIADDNSSGVKTA